MSLADVASYITEKADKAERHRAASRKYRESNAEACRVRVRASKLKAKLRAPAQGPANKGGRERIGKRQMG